MKVPQEYELAFSAALGEMLEGIILDEGSSTEEILEYLEKSKTSRTVFLPNWWKINAQQKPISGNARRAAELINDDSNYAHLIKRSCPRLSS